MISCLHRFLLKVRLQFRYSFQIVLFITIGIFLGASGDVEGINSPETFSNEISLNPIVLLAADLTNDYVGDVIWGSKDLILAFDGNLPFHGDPRDIIWLNTSTISEFKAVKAIESQGKMTSLVVANSTAIGLIGVHDGFESRVISTHPMIISQIAGGFMNADPKPDIITATEDGNLLCFESSGDSLWNHTTSETIRALAVGDLDGKNQEDVVAAYENEIIAFRGSNGDVLGNWSISSEATHFLIGPLNKNPTEYGFVVLEANGVGSAYITAESAPLWSTLISTEAIWKGLSPIFSENEKLDFVVATKNGLVARMNRTSGEPIWTRNLSVEISGDVIVSNITAGEALDLVLPTANGTIMLSGEGGTTLSHFRFPGETKFAMSADWNNDTVADIGAATSDGWLFSFDYLTGLPIWSFQIANQFGLANEGPYSNVDSSIPDGSNSDIAQGNDEPNLPIAEVLIVVIILMLGMLAIIGIKRRMP
jgi:outer membrane protein assembly factor BamB